MKIQHTHPWHKLSLVLMGSTLMLSACADGSDPASEADELSGSDDARAGVTAAIFTTGTPQEVQKAAELSLREMSRIAPDLNPRTDLTVLRSFVDELSMAHTHFQQLYKGIPVFGGEAIVHLDRDGSFFRMTRDLVDHVKVDAEPLYSKNEAIELAIGYYGCDDCLTATPTADLWILRHEGQDHLAFRVQLRREDGTQETAMPVLFIDAHTGDLVWQYNNLQTGSGSSLYSGTVSIGTLSYNGSYYLEDTTRRVGAFDMGNSQVYYNRFTDTDDVWNSSSQQAGVDAHFGAEMVYDYYLNVHGRNGIDGSGGPGYVSSANGATTLVSHFVHYGSSYNNAYWSGSYMVYGDGDGSTFSPLVSLDIVGHEMTHGVTERTSNLTYSGESGALNESMSDVMGAMVERYVEGETTNTWRIGEEVYTPSTSGDALRYMDDPHLAGDYGYTSNDDPDHYSERYTGSSDNGGVHINSGISNKTFYLLAVGGTHHLGGSMTGIGANDAAKIWYKALTSYMTSSTNFSGARAATISAATALFGASSTQCTAVVSAWDLTGVSGGTCSSSGGSGTELLTNGGFESTYSPWVKSGYAYYTSNGTTPHGGTGYMYLGYYNNVTGYVYESFSIPSSASSANLTFWLNVSSSETTTTTAYDKLYAEVRNSSGSVLATLATYSNLNKTSGSTYTQMGPFDLSAYKGQTVRVHFRVSNDKSYATTFRIDDASVK